MDVAMSSPGSPRTAYTPGKSTPRETASNEDRQEGTSGNEQPASTGGGQMSQARVVQTAFVQKLYNMLDSEANSKVISWSPSGDSFIVNPGSEFQNVLASYFKHTNPQSFVRQLNMYGFHKVNDVFQGSPPDTHLWEFKHGEGNFRRGDIDGLREIKRRPSRHHLAIHRENQHPALPHLQPAAVVPVAVASHDPLTARLDMIEHNVYDMHLRLVREEDARAQLSTRHQQLHDRSQQLTEALVLSQKNNRALAGLLVSLHPDANHPVHRDVMNLQTEIDRQVDYLRQHELPQDRHASVSFEGAQGSYYDDPRRNTLARHKQPPAGRPGPLSPRKLAPYPGSMQPTAANGDHLTPLPPPPAPSRPPTGMSPPPYLSRRHTSADVRLNPGWKSAYSSSEHLPLRALPNPSSTSGGQSPYASNGGSEWPPSSLHHRPSQGAEQLRESLGRYQIDSRNASLASDATAIPSRRPSEQFGEGGFAHPSTHAGPLLGGPSGQEGSSLSGRPLFNSSVFNQGPNSTASTRRSSMAHLLNPADTAERDDEDDLAPDDRGKRKRVE